MGTNSFEDDIRLYNKMQDKNKKLLNLLSTGGLSVAQDRLKHVEKMKRFTDKIHAKFPDKEKHFVGTTAMDVELARRAVQFLK